MIEFRDVTFTYSDESLCIRDLNFSVKKGECVVLCGKSGSGKSTVLRMVTGLIPIFYEGTLQGTVEVEGHVPEQLSSEDRAVWFGVVFQDPRSQFFMSTVQDEICFAAENIGISPSEIRRRIREVASFLGIEELLLRNIEELSSGQKQKIAIASSLILEPKVLILDEPTSNLDVEGVAVLIEIIKKIKERGISVLLSEHRLDYFQEVADRFLYMDRGMLKAVWSREEFENLSDEARCTFGLRPRAIEENQRTMIFGEPVLEMEALSFRYKKTKKGIENINLELHRGEVLSLLGENGVGKTTLCRVISGLLKEDAGKVRYRGKTVNCGDRNQLCYFVMQDADYQLYSDSVTGELALGKKVTEKLKREIAESLEIFRLTELKGRHPASLSGGEKQRVTLAAAYCSNAEVYILDEPTSGMDGEGLQTMIRWVKLLSEKGKIVLIITHDPLLAKATSHTCIYLTGGRQAEHR